MKAEDELPFGVQRTRVQRVSYVEFEFTKKLKESEKAILLAYEEDGKQKTVWLPLSQIRKIETNSDGSGTAEITQWIADKNNLEY